MMIIMMQDFMFGVKKLLKLGLANVKENHFFLKKHALHILSLGHVFINHLCIKNSIIFRLQLKAIKS